MRIKENKNVKNAFDKAKRILKIVLFITMLVLTYFVSEYFINYIITIDTEILKRILNIILVSIVVYIFYK